MQLTVDSGQLPVGWKIKYLDELCENLDSKRVPITKSSRKSGSIPYMVLLALLITLLITSLMKIYFWCLKMVRIFWQERIQ